VAAVEWWWIAPLAVLMILFTWALIAENRALARRRRPSSVGPTGDRADGPPV